MNLYTLDREKREKRLQGMMGDMGMAMPVAPQQPSADIMSRPFENSQISPASDPDIPDIPDMLSDVMSDAMHGADSMHGAMPDARPGTPPGLDEAPCAPLPPDRSELLRGLEEMRQKFEEAREEPLSALMILAEVERGAQGLKEGCLRLGLRSIADVLALLSATLKRTEPLNPAHMELLSLELDAARAMFRIGNDQPAASEELLHALRAAARRHFSGAF